MKQEIKQQKFKKIKKVTRSYFKKPISTHQRYLDEMEKILDRYKIPKLNWDQRDHLNRLTSSKEIEVIIEILLPKNKNKTTNNNNNNNKKQDQMVLVQKSIKPSKKSYHQYFTYSSTKYKQKEHYTPCSMKPQLC